MIQFAFLKKDFIQMYITKKLSIMFLSSLMMSSGAFAQTNETTNEHNEFYKTTTTGKKILFKRDKGESLNALTKCIHHYNQDLTSYESFEIANQINESIVYTKNENRYSPKNLQDTNCNNEEMISFLKQFDLKNND